MRCQTLVALSLHAAAVLAAPLLTPRADVSGFNWGSDVVRGVNLGGWLVLEPWITPSLFNPYPVSEGIVDEWTLCEKKDCGPILEKHWSEWLSPADFSKISNAGFNLVRIPIGFWAYDNANTPYYQGAAQRLDIAIGWARDAKLKVLIDLHGAPGSQNGFDNSGRKLSNAYGVAAPGWFEADPGAVRTLAVLNTIQQKYGDTSYDDVIAGIELVNEPAGYTLDVETIKTFHVNGYNQQRKYSQSRAVVISDAFVSTNNFNGWMTPSSPQAAQNVVMDHHEYQVFSNDQVALSVEGHLLRTCNNYGTYYGSDKWTIVGEWSGAMTDCATWLNGYGIGARYDGSYPNSTFVGTCDGVNDISKWSDQRKSDYRTYIELQMAQYEKQTRGWIWWNFKTEGTAAEWDAFVLLDNGVMPNPVSSRTGNFICP